jgi:hypothetical protein
MSNKHYQHRTNYFQRLNIEFLMICKLVDVRLTSWVPHVGAVPLSWAEVSTRYWVGEGKLARPLVHLFPLFLLSMFNVQSLNSNLSLSLNLKLHIKCTSKALA